MRYSKGAMLLFGAVLGCAGSKSDAPVRGGAVPARSDTGVQGGVTATPVTDNPAATRRVLFLGTSLTAGLGLEPDSAYPSLVQRKIDSAGLAFQVVNAGVSGETSAGLLQRLDWVLRQPASVIVVETGANDGLRGQSVEATKATIGQVLDRIKHDKPGAKVVLVQMEAPTNMGVGYTRPFHAMFPALAREKGVALLPFLLDGVAGKPSLNQADGIHPNYEGEAIVASNVWRGLEGLLRSVNGEP
jgi:Lysophospholipase L1 and related esterases